MLNYYCTYLIDEPESFLHPPQARIMGQIIGETLSDQQQAFISTHSEDIIKGLLETCPERLKIIRITREGDTNYFSILDNDKFSEIWNDPLLKHSNIMSSLFHKTVVLCESDADCQMYSIIESYIKQKQGKYAEALFIHCGGKQRMARIISALRALNIDVKTIPDLDMLNDAGDNYEEYTIDFEEELRKLKAALEKLPEDTLFDMNDSYDYLDEFLHISAKAVFNPDNNNLNNLVFRKSQTLDALYSIGRMPFVRGKAGKRCQEGKDGIRVFLHCFPKRP